MTTIYYLYHRHSFPEYGVEEEDEKLIGVYSSHENAEKAIERLKDKPGFSKYPDGFEIMAGELDDDGWETGFVSFGEALASLPD